MELTWLADIPQSRHRSRAAKACSSCQRKKKRCRHFSSSVMGSNDTRRRVEHDSTSTPNSRVGESSRVASNPPPDSVPEVRQSRSSHADVSTASSVLPRSTRFVGDLNPEAVLLGKLDEASQGRRNRIGLWVSSSDKKDEENGRLPSTTNASQSLEPYVRSSVNEGRVFLSLHQRYLAAIESCQPLPAPTQEHLVSIYFSKINPVLPLLERDPFLRDCRNGNVSVLLVRAICLVAAKDEAARSHLRLKDIGPCLTPRQFCSELYKGLVPAINSEVEPDRITRIQILALLSLHCEGVEGAEAASLHLCQAVHQAQTVGLHLNHPGRAVDDHLSRLFWCLWSLDKLHASIGGRPILMADRDIGIEKPNINSSSSTSAFDIWFAISDLLASVISLYRPSVHPDLTWQDDFPVFADIVGKNSRDNHDPAILGLLELFYHSVSILSCRSGSAGPGSFAPSHTNRDISASRICSIMASEWAQKLPPLPIVPYAVSLSMSVSYQQLRQGDLDISFDQAKSSLASCCLFLEQLSLSWESANAMCRLGRRALKQIDDARLSQYQPPTQQSRMLTGRTARSHVAGDELSSRGVRSMIPGQKTDHVMNDLSMQESSSSVEERLHTASKESVVPVEQEADLPLADAHYSLDEGFNGGSFEDIDMLFGEYLDLSLPTNFWDPIFMEDGNT